MSNPQRFVDHFKHRNTVEVGLGSKIDLTTAKSDFRTTLDSGNSSRTSRHVGFMP
jgi:hypothetical protein